MTHRAAAVALAVAAAAPGCASTALMNGIMQSWQGTYIDEVIQRWGYPDEERVIAGKRLLYWDRSVQLALPATATTQGTLIRTGPGTASYSGQTSVTGGGSSTWSCIRILEIDASSRVVGWQWGGNNCPFLEAGPYSTWRR